MNRIEKLEQAYNDGNLRRRFESKLIKLESGCWEMQTHHDKDGYPLIWFDTNNVRAAQMSIVLYKHEKISNRIVCHTCDNPKCVNPEHLFISDNSGNTRDMLSKKRGCMQKITETQVLEIYVKHFKGYTNKKLAAEYGLSASTICNILKGRNWEWLYDRYLALAAKYKGR